MKVDFRSPNFAGVSGFQGTLNTKYEVGSGNPPTSLSEPAPTSRGAGGKNGVQTLLFESISTEGSLKLSDKNVGLRYTNEGLITMSWSTNTGIDVDANSVLFSMTFVAQKDGKLSNVMHIGSQRTKAESYEGRGTVGRDAERSLGTMGTGNLSIRFVDKSGKEISGTNTLYQNYPNPFDQRTVIGINLTQSINGTLNVTDITGRVIKSISRDWNKGYNEVWLDRREVKATGVLFYTFESKVFTASKKMIILE